LWPCEIQSWKVQRNLQKEFGSIKAKIFNEFLAGQQGGSGVGLQNAPHANAKGAKRTWSSPRPRIRILGAGMQGQRSGQHHFIFPFGRWLGNRAARRWP